MPLLTEQELERIEALGARWITEEYLIALIASHREQGALIKELAEVLDELLLSADHQTKPTHLTYVDCKWCRARAALSKVPR
jgi:hypothetical protein